MMGALLAGLQVGCAVLTAGYALFRLRMIRSLARADRVERERLWESLRGFGWPPGLPFAMSLDALGWILLLGATALTLGPELIGRSPQAVPAALFFGAALVAHVFVIRAPAPAAGVAFMLTVLAAIFVGVTPRAAADAYTLVLGLHVLAASLWLGHMFFWSLISGPALKRLPEPERGVRLRTLSLEGGGLGWPALAVLFVTGAVLLWRRGLVPADLVAPAFLGQRFGLALDVKLVIALLMVGYQAVFGHREAPRAIYLNMLAAVAVLALAVLMTGV